MQTNLVDSDVIARMVDQLPESHQIESIANRNIIVWSTHHLRTEKGDVLDYVGRPYLVEYLEDWAPHIVVEKGAQTGYTQGAITKSLFIADGYGRTIIYTFPTKSDVVEFSKARFGPIIRESKYLNSRVKEYDSASMKKIGNATLYFKGTWAERQAISVPSDINAHDELDFSDPQVRETYSSRLDASSWDFNGVRQEGGWEWDFSTPTLPDFGIDALYKKSDMRVWLVKCDSCGKRQRVDFFRNVKKIKNGKKWLDIYACNKCGHELNRLKGSWRAKRPQREIHGYHVPQTICDWISATRLVGIYDNAKGNAVRMRKFHNYNLAIPYESGSDVLTRDLIHSRWIKPSNETGPIFIGLDQGDTIHYEVTKLINGRRHIIWIGTVYSFDEVSRIIENYNPKAVVIDALPNHHSARELAKKHHNVYVCYYGGSKKLSKTAWETDLEKKEVHVPRTDLMDLTAAQWNTGDVQVEADMMSPVILDEFVDQMVALKRDQEVRRDGEMVAVWKAIGDDHYRHADGYNWLATEIGSRNYSDVKAISARQDEISTDGELFNTGDSW